jgi:hypothetical protein
MVVADNDFNTTRQNILKGGRKGTIPFICKHGKARQIKGSLEYPTKGEIFDHMKTWNPVKHPGMPSPFCRWRNALAVESESSRRQSQRLSYVSQESPSAGTVHGSSLHDGLQRTRFLYPCWSGGCGKGMWKGERCSNMQ